MRSPSSSRTGVASSRRALGFSHRYLTIVSTSGAPEMWYLNGFDSQAEIDGVVRALAATRALTDSLAGIVREKEPLLRAPSTDAFAHYRDDDSRGAPWTMGAGPFLVIASFSGRSPLDATVYGFDGGEKLAIRAAATLEEARAVAARAGGQARVFEIFHDFQPAMKTPR